MTNCNNGTTQKSPTAQKTDSIKYAATWLLTSLMF